MYETIMSLPLFYGISHDHVSRFVAKTHLSFYNYAAGEIITDPGDSSDQLLIIVSGKVRITHTKAAGALTIEEVCTRGRILGAERLFGLRLAYPFRAEALEPTGIMSFSKDEYLNLLRSETIYMVNYINFLAVRAQRPLDFVMKKNSASLLDYLAAWLLIFTEPKAESYLLRCSRKDLITLTNLDEERIVREGRQLEEMGLIRRGEGMVHILDRQSIIELAEHHILD